MWLNLQENPDLVAFTEDIVHVKLDFLCSVTLKSKNIFYLDWICGFTSLKSLSSVQIQKQGKYVFHQMCFISFRVCVSSFMNKQKYPRCKWLIGLLMKNAVLLFSIYNGHTTTTVIRTTLNVRLRRFIFYREICLQFTGRAHVVAWLDMNDLRFGCTWRTSSRSRSLRVTTTIVSTNVFIAIIFLSTWVSRKLSKVIVTSTWTSFPRWMFTSIITIIFKWFWYMLPTRWLFYWNTVFVSSSWRRRRKVFFFVVFKKEIGWTTAANGVIIKRGHRSFMATTAGLYISAWRRRWFSDFIYCWKVGSSKWNWSSFRISSHVGFCRTDGYITRRFSTRSNCTIVDLKKSWITTEVMTVLKV